MSKLTAQQKAANKAAQKIRDRAYSARHREYRNELAKAKEMAESGEIAKQRDAAVLDFERELSKKNQAISDIQKEIAALEAKRNRIQQQYESSIAPKKALRDSAYQAFRDHTNALEMAVHARYPDMVSCFYVSQWEIPADVRAQMEAAREAA